MEIEITDSHVIIYSVSLPKYVWFYLNPFSTFFLDKSNNPKPQSGHRNELNKKDKMCNYQRRWVSGMDKYNHLIFDHNLTAPQMKYYNNGCEYIFYKDNIVLMYGSGAIGSPCFPYEDPE